jgi:hypothetical protein
VTYETYRDTLSVHEARIDQSENYLWEYLDEGDRGRLSEVLDELERDLHALHQQVRAEMEVLWKGEDIDPDDVTLPEPDGPCDEFDDPVLRAIAELASILMEVSLCLVDPLEIPADPRERTDEMMAWRLIFKMADLPVLDLLIPKVLAEVQKVRDLAPAD